VKKKLFPDAALEQRTAHEIESPSGLVHDADDLHQIVVDDVLARDELGVGKTGGEIP
jgi:hypothetical protein